MASSREDAECRPWRRHRHLTIPIFFLALLGSVVGICPLPLEGVIGEATVAALVALHRGPNCSRVELRGLQQAAAAGLAVRRVNEEHAEAKDGLSIGLQVLDTCSEPEEAVKMALRSLVSSVQASHLPPPLFLGFLGPDEAATLDAVQKVTSVFKLSHVTPISLRGRVFNPLHVVAVNPREKVKMIMNLLRRLDWTSFSLLHAGDAISSEVARILASEATSDGVDPNISPMGHGRDPMCVLSVQVLPLAYDAERYGEIIKELGVARQKGGIVVDLKGKQAAFAAAAAAAAAAGRGPPGVVIIGSTPGPISDLLRYVEVWGLGKGSKVNPGSAITALGGTVNGKDDAAFLISVSSTGLLPELAALQTGPSLSILVIQETVAVHSEEDEEDDEVDNEVPDGTRPEAEAHVRPSIHRLADTVANSTLWPPYLLATRGCGGNGGSVSVVSSCVDAAARSNVEDFYLVQDPSVVPVMDAIRLFSSALSVAHSAKCGPNPGRCPELVTMTAEEWRSLLATATVGETNGRQVHFQMHRETAAQLYAKTPADANPAFLVGTVTSRLRKVGNMTGGGEINLIPGFRFPVSHNADGVRCKVSSVPSTLPAVPSAPASPVSPAFPPSPGVTVSIKEETASEAVQETPTTVAAVPTPPKSRPPPRQPPPPPPKQDEVAVNGGEEEDDDDDDDDGGVFGMDLFDGLTGENMWEVIAILVAIGVGILATFGVCIYAVYAMFRVRNDSDGGGGRRSSRRRQRRQSNASVQSIQS